MRFHLSLTIVASLALSSLGSVPASAFCGFYVAKADTQLFNKASKVVIVRDEDRTVMTMANDFRGDPREFAVVIPVPTFIEREQINVADRAVIDHLDAYTAPRLVEYHDRNPCHRYMERRLMMPSSAAPLASEMAFDAAKSLGVTIEAQYAVGEYEILILSAEESKGLETWLVESGYRIPSGATSVLGSYIRQKMRFFVAKVDLDRQAELGYSFLRPLQVAFETPKFMLPIRLGTVNADGEQELFVFVLNRKGRVETTNYRTVELPSNVELPELVEARFNDFYRDMFSHQVITQRRRAVFLEYAWDMAWCDPCAADPLNNAELRQLGVFWQSAGLRSAVASDVFVTRLHLRYTGETFPEDLFFQETGDRSNFQGRYIIRHPWRGSKNECSAARDYLGRLPGRLDEEARNLARLTGWELEGIRRDLDLYSDSQIDRGDGEPWWKKLWAGP